MADAINPSDISYKHKINSMTVQGESNGAGAWVTTGEQEGKEQYDKEGDTGQAMLPDDSRAYVSVHGLLKGVTTAFFDMQIVNLDSGSYLCRTSAKALKMAEKEKKDKYLQPCVERRCYFTPMVYSADVIPGTEAIGAQQRISLLLSIKMKREYLEMCGFVRAWMSLAIVISNNRLLHGARGKEAYTTQQYRS